MYDIVKALLLDDNLTVKNANQRGYEWCGDIGKFTPPEIIELIIALVKNKGYKIGCARWCVFNRTEQDNRGLYCPLPKTQEDNQQKKMHWRDLKYHTLHLKKR